MIKNIEEYINYIKECIINNNNYENNENNENMKIYFSYKNFY